jgi:hypothetical protein
MTQTELHPLPPDVLTEPEMVLPSRGTAVAADPTSTDPPSTSVPTTPAP